MGLWRAVMVRSRAEDRIQGLVLARPTEEFLLLLDQNLNPTRKRPVSRIMQQGHKVTSSTLSSKPTLLYKSRGGGEHLKQLRSPWMDLYFLREKRKLEQRTGVYGSQEFLNLERVALMSLFYVYEYFAHMYVCVPYMWMVPSDVRRGHPLELE
ncbi:hypothetical protein STEG23_008229 [Scotinomys teguina]